jgi:hypothetical protein
MSSEQAGGAGAKGNRSQDAKRMRQIIYTGNALLPLTKGESLVVLCSRQKFEAPPKIGEHGSATIASGPWHRQSARYGRVWERPGLLSLPALQRPKLGCLNRSQTMLGSRLYPERHQ